MSITDFSTEKVILDRLKVGAEVSLPRYVAANLELATWQDDLLDRMVYQLRSEVLAQTLSRREVTQPAIFEHPATTWQMFKHRTAHTKVFGWIARRWPVRNEKTVKYVKMVALQQATFPDAGIKFPPSLGNPVYIERLVAP